MHNYFIGEMLGTMILIVFGCGAVASALLKQSKGEGGGWICITTGWCFGVVFGVFVAQAAGSIQADINPAVTLAKYFLHIYSSIAEVLLRMAAELIGAFLGAVIVWLTYLSHWPVTENKQHKLAVFVTGPAISGKKFNNLITEIIGTFVLIFGIGALSFGFSAGQHAPLVPYFVGLLVWAIGLALGGPTGYAINPARDFGPRIAHAILPISGKGSSEWNYALVPIVGPIIGALLGAALWAIIFIK